MGHRNVRYSEYSHSIPFHVVKLLDHWPASSVKQIHGYRHLSIVPALPPNLDEWEMTWECCKHFIFGRADASASAERRENQPLSRHVLVKSRRRIELHNHHFQYRAHTHSGTCAPYEDYGQLRFTNHVLILLRI